MIRLRRTLLRGVAAVLPIALTLYIVYWLAVTLEQALGFLFKAVLPENYYLPGLGLLSGIVLLVFVGLSVNAFIVKWVLRLGEQLFERIPFVKSIYGAVRDFIAFFTSDSAQSDVKRVVSVRFGDARLIGFMTRDQVDDFGLATADEDLVAVYLPMSYQIGGYTAFLPRSQIELLDIDVEDAMRLVLTAGLASARAKR